MMIKVGDKVKIIRPLSVKLKVSKNPNLSIGRVTEIEMKEARVKTSYSPDNTGNWEAFAWISKRN